MEQNWRLLSELMDKQQIRELAMLYSRGVDRKDPDLLRSLYTADATDTHGTTFDGTAADYVAFLEGAFPYMRYSGHHICNHLISINGDEGEGEVYALAYHLIPNRQAGWIEDVMCVRYLDRYRRESGQWRFAQRIVTYDYRSQRAVPNPDDAIPMPNNPHSTFLESRLFGRGART